MIIYNRDGSVLADVWLQESSFVNEEIMGDHSAQIDFLSRYPIDLEIGDYIEHEGNIYTLRHKESVTKRETSLGWDYSVVMYSARYELQDVPFFLSDEPQYLKNGDYYTGTASDWLNLIIRNMNREISGWAAGSCVESEWITISFKDKQCSEVLDELCAQLDTEWQVIGRTLSIGRVEYPSDGLVLSQGEGGGLKELRLSSSNQERPVTVLYPYGSDKNLPEGYGSDYLLLPGGQKVMERNVDKYGRCGMKVQFNVYPKGEFTVTSVIDDLTFTADGIDFNIADCLIPDTEVTVSFQSGALAGYDLAIAEDGWDNATKQIKVLQNEEENSLKVPGDLHIAVGDRFTLFNLRMPEAYVTKAEEELRAKAEAWLAKKSEKEVRLSAKCDDILFRQCGVHIRCGQMVRILSLELDMDREIRVTKVKRHIENDCPTYRYELTLSDFLDTNGFKQLVKEVENVPEEIKTETKPFKAWTRRSWRDVMETLTMMFDPEGDYFTELIKPLAVHTAQLIVGTNSQQMDLVGVRFIPNKGGDPNIFASTAGKLEHFTISEEGVREWNIAASEYTLNPNTPYYVYAKCPRTGTEGTIICSTDKIKLEDDADYYHFWVGVLNSPYEGSRSWNPNYGYTEIAGQTITTGTIKDKSGQSYFDLTNNKFRMGGQQGSLDWNVTKDDQLTLRGCLYQSPAGDVDYPEVDRGAYSDTVVYYPGDKVSYNGNVYKCIKQTTAGVSPINETYWKILVYRGSTAFKSTVFKRSNAKPSAPTGGSFDAPVPSGWSDGVPSGEAIIWASTRIFTSDGQSPQQASWTDPQQMTDTADFDVEFSSVASPNPPVNHPNTNTQWSNTANESTIWMATSTKKNGVWSDWSVSKIKGEKGDKGAFKSTVFKRSNAKPSAPTGGSFDAPVPSGWSDGVPSGEAIIWASTCTFNADGTSTGWSDPAAQSDTATLDIEFSPKETQPSAPSGTTPFANHESEGWYDPSSANFAGKTMIWRAERKVSNGAYNGEWTITRIYGEKGDPGVPGEPGEPGEPGAPGAQGLQGPATPFRGLYYSNKTYYGNTSRTDIVYLQDSYGNKTFYRARTDAPKSSFYGVSPTNTNYWVQFGAHYDNVATDLLLARKILASEIECDNLSSLSAKIGGFNIGDTYLNSDSGCYFRTYSGTVGAYIGAQKMILDKVSRDISVSGTGAFFSSAYINDLYVFGDVKKTLSIGSSSDNGYYGLRIHNSKNDMLWFIRTDNGMYLSFDGGTDNHKASFQYTDGVCNAWVSGAYNKGSDIRIKDRLDDVTGVLEKIEQLTPFRYKLKGIDSPLTFIGLSAQDVQSVFPEVVSETYYNEEFGNILALDYSVLSAVISVGGLKELHAKVKALEDRVKALEG